MPRVVQIYYCPVKLKHWWQAQNFLITGSSRLIRISLLRFFKTFTKIWLMQFMGYLFCCCVHKIKILLMRFLAEIMLLCPNGSKTGLNWISNVGNRRKELTVQIYTLCTHYFRHFLTLFCPSSRIQYGSDEGRHSIWDFVELRPKLGRWWRLQHLLLYPAVGRPEMVAGKSLLKYFYRFGQILWKFMTLVIKINPADPSVQYTIDRHTGTVIQDSRSGLLIQKWSSYTQKNSVSSRLQLSS